VIVVKNSKPKSQDPKLDPKPKPYRPPPSPLPLKPDDKEKSQIHSGRIQAQGNGVEKSEAWLQTVPLTRTQGQAVLRALVAKLTDEERSQRTSAIIKASEYIEKIAALGGTGPTSESFLEIKYTKTPSEIECPKNTRIDIEVRRGWAFELP
jgi:hypothetical protein